jgi:hypothetical protein
MCDGSVRACVACDAPIRMVWHDKVQAGLYAIELGVSREDMVRKLAPLRRQVEALRAALISRRD